MSAVTLADRYIGRDGGAPEPPPPPPSKRRRWLRSVDDMSFDDLIATVRRGLNIDAAMAAKLTALEATDVLVQRNR